MTTKSKAKATTAQVTTDFAAAFTGITKRWHSDWGTCPTAIMFEQAGALNPSGRGVELLMLAMALRPGGYTNKQFEAAGTAFKALHGDTVPCGPANNKRKRIIELRRAKYADGLAGPAWQLVPTAPIKGFKVAAVKKAKAKRVAKAKPVPFSEPVEAPAHTDGAGVAA